MGEIINEIGQYLESSIILLKSAISEYRTQQLAVNNEIKDLQKYIRHFHAVHAHPCCHSYDGNIDHHHYNDPLFTTCQQHCFETKFYPDAFPTLVDLLIKESSFEQDYDNNRLIFLQDFMFNSNDKKVPKILHAMQRISLKNNNIPKYTWNDYLSTVSKQLY